ncbi:MAG: hypothetical protein VKJ04_04670 [Vampirovibrionales bacterium]|nr:hypothetical protein [Vampirovibrionales bacterium]
MNQKKNHNISHPKTAGWHKKDILKERFGSSHALGFAKNVLESDEQSEEAFLGAQAVLMLQGLI